MPRSTERGATLGCFPGGGRRLTSPPLAATYEEGSTSAPSTSTSVGTGSPSSSVSTSSPGFLDELAPLYHDDSEEEADAGGLSTAIASRRFFFASPGRSNSIVDSSEHAAASHGGRSVPSNSARSSGGASAGPAGAAATPAKALRAGEEEDDTVRRISVSTYAPRVEFLKSMVEMADALELDPRRSADHVRLHDLLLCYIALNDHDSLRDILGAFTDLLCLLNANNASNSTTTTDGGGKREA